MIPGPMTMHDSHGPDHGLRVVLRGRDVEIRVWHVFDEPDHDGLNFPCLLEGTTDLTTALLYAVHDDRHVQPSMHERVAAGAMVWLYMSGIAAQPLDDDQAKPCDYFAFDPSEPCPLCKDRRPPTTKP